MSIADNSNGSPFEKFSPEAKKALFIAEEEAKKDGTNYISTEHILLGILQSDKSFGNSILGHFGITTETTRAVMSRVQDGRRRVRTRKEIELSTYAKQVVEIAYSLAHKYGHSNVGTEHLLLALVSQKDTGAITILEKLNVMPKKIKAKVQELFSQKLGTQVSDEDTEINDKNIVNANSEQMKDLLQPFEKFLSSVMGEAVMREQLKDQEKKRQQVQSKTPALDFFTTDLVKEAKEEKLEPIIGREPEIERTISILARKTKNNPILIGEPGVGKTAIAEGLAQRIANGNVPGNLYNKRILSLDMTTLVAGTKYRGEFEGRLKQIIDEASSEDSNVILFVDEIHTIIGAGSAEGSLDAANILKPALSRGKIQVIGATTIKEYRKHIESDSAFERRFQQVIVDEPSAEITLELLKGIRYRYEDFHNVKIPDETLEAAVKLSKRYIQDRFLPDKAIDLMDEASALHSIKRDNAPIKELTKMKSKYETLANKRDNAVAVQDFEEAAKIKGELDTLTEKMELLKKQSNLPRSLRSSIVPENVAEVISKATGIPLQKLISEELSTLKDLESTLKKHIIGQDEAISEVSKAIKRSRTGISSADRPIGSFLFLGPTGVGKTELVKQLAKEVFNDKNALIRVDMSEFMEKHNVSRLIGATAGYVGYEEGGQLTEQIRRKPYSIVLFDEVEKAHPEALNILLQVLEEGELTDGKGRKVNFRNTIVVMTSNIGADKFTKKAAQIGFDTTESALEKDLKDFEVIKNQVLEELKKRFKPELLNRIDKTIVFKALTREHLEEIVKLEIAKLSERLKQNKLSIKASKKALTYLAEKSYQPEFGARPIRRTIQELVEDAIADMIVHEKIKEGSEAKIDVSKEGIVVKV